MPSCHTTNSHTSSLTNEITNDSLSQQEGQKREKDILDIIYYNNHTNITGSNRLGVTLVFTCAMILLYWLKFRENKRKRKNTIRRRGRFRSVNENPSIRSRTHKIDETSFRSDSCSPVSLSSVSTSTTNISKASQASQDSKILKYSRKTLNVIDEGPSSKIRSKNKTLNLPNAVIKLEKILENQYNQQMVACRKNRVKTI